jgi:LPS-assembly protein
MLSKTFKYSPLAWLICLYCTVAGAVTPITEASTHNSDSEGISDTKQPRVAASHNLDWVEKQDMTSQQQAHVESYCCGAYVEPKRDYPDANRDPDQAPLRVNALSTEAQSEAVAVLEGDVHISQGYRQVRSDKALVDQSNRQIILNGNVRFREPNMLLIGDNAKLDLDTEEVEIDNATYVLHQASVRGTAKTLQRTSDGTIVIDDATYSGCEPTDNTWQLTTSQIKLDQKSGFATVKNARLDIKQVPVFYFPYAKFPISDRRSTGLLFPAIAVDQENGLDFSQPIYLNLAPNYDATLTPRYIQERGTGLETTFRHLSNWSKTDIMASFLGNDKGGSDKSKLDPISGLYTHQGEDRYTARIVHRGTPNHAWSTFLDYNHVSDVDYFNDIGQMLQGEDEHNRTHLQRVASISYRTAHWNFVVDSRDYQSVTAGLADQYSVLPNISIEGNYKFNNSLFFNSSNQYSLFRHKDKNVITGDRTRLNYNIGWDKQWGWGYLKPKFGVRHLAYNLDIPDNHSTPLQDSPAITVPVVSFDSNLLLERDSHWFAGLKQTLEPRLFYIRAKSKDQQYLPDFDTKEFTPSYDLLFRENRYYGGDRITDDHRLTLGVSTRFINNRTGREQFRASLAQALYLDDRQVTLSPSPSAQKQLEMRQKKSYLALEMAAQIDQNWRLNSEFIYDNHDNHWEKSGVGIHYSDRQDRLFNLSYRYSRRAPKSLGDTTLAQHIEQADMSFYMPLGDDFNWVGRWHYDFTNNRELESFAGFEYNNCCWRASLVIRRWLDREDELLIPEQNLESNNGVFLQIQFRGLAGTGGRVDSILKKGIYGYEPLESF